MSNVIFFSWNRSIPGREQISAEHFGEFVQYLSGLQQDGTIESFEPVFLNPHNGTTNGFFYIKGTPEKLGALVASDDWENHMTRAMMHLEGAGAVGGVTGDALMARMEKWTAIIPS